MTLRRLETEYEDSPDRKYAYSFDYLMHDFMLRTWAPLPTGRALEMGCYKGAMTAKLIPLFDSLVVVEGVEDLIKEARKVAPAAEYVHSRFEDYEPYEPFDAIFLVHTLEHIENPVTLLRHVRNWLKPQGRLYLAVPNAHAASRQIALEMGLVKKLIGVTEGEWKHGHRRTYNASTLIRDVFEAGMRDETWGGIFFKALSSQQIDLAFANKVIDGAYLEACYQLGKRYPDMCASIYCVAMR